MTILNPVKKKGAKSKEQVQVDAAKEAAAEAAEELLYEDHPVKRLQLLGVVKRAEDVERAHLKKEAARERNDMRKKAWQARYERENEEAAAKAKKNQVAKTPVSPDVEGDKAKADVEDGKV